MRNAIARGREGSATASRSVSLVEPLEQQLGRVRSFNNYRIDTQRKCARMQMQINTTASAAKSPPAEPAEEVKAHACVVRSPLLIVSPQTHRRRGEAHLSEQRARG